ncbi:hypothetical protein HY772_08010 [Candidatus Woesearchaeota archaeon]|nr:hypothetical protein [Candidatus Woesearchaeota archaeon]
MVRIRPNPRLIKKLEKEDKKIGLLSQAAVKKKADYFTQRENKLRHLIEPRPIFARVKRLLAKRRSLQLKSRLSRLEKNRSLKTRTRNRHE